MRCRFSKTELRDETEYIWVNKIIAGNYDELFKTLGLAEMF